MSLDSHPKKIDSFGAVKGESMNNEIIVNKIGYVFPPAMRFSGWALMAAGILAVIFEGMAGLLIVLVGVSLVFLKEYVLVDPANHRVKRSRSFFPQMPIGKWHGIENYPFVSVVRKVISTNLTSHAGHQETSTGRNMFYDVMLLSNSHRSKILIQRNREKEVALEAASMFGRRLAREVVSFKPRVSEATRKRARARR